MSKDFNNSDAVSALSVVVIAALALVIVLFASCAQAAPLLDANKICPNLATFSEGGAIYRARGQTEKELLSAVIEQGQAHGASETTIKAALILAVFGYHSNLSPAEAKTQGEAQCRKGIAMANAERGTAL